MDVIENVLSDGADADAKLEAELASREPFPANLHVHVVRRPEPGLDLSARAPQHHKRSASSQNATAAATNRL